MPIENVNAVNTTQVQKPDSANQTAKIQTATKPYPNDTVEINGKKKTGMSNGTKVGIGLGILGTAAIALGLILKGKSSHAKKVVEHIDFKEAKTFKEAEKFAKEKLGVLYYDINDLEVANFVNEWLTQIHNKCKIIDKTSYPKLIASCNEEHITTPFCMTSSLKVNKKFEGHILGINMNTFNNFDEFLNNVIGSVITKNKNGKFEIVKDIYKTDFAKDIVDRMNHYSSKNSFKEKVELINDIESLYDCWIKDGKIKVKTRSIYYNLNHELGHLRHQYSAPNYEMMKTVEEFKTNNKPVSEITKEFLKDKSIQTTARKVSNYSMKSPREFVAETFANLMERKTLPEDVMALYKKYNGPTLPA